MSDSNQPTASERRFSLREKARLRQGLYIPVVYESIPTNFAVQAFKIIENVIGKYNIHSGNDRISSGDMWRNLHERLADDFGVFYFTHRSFTPSEDIARYITSEKINYIEVLDMVETSLFVIRIAEDAGAFDNAYKHLFHAIFSYDDAVAQLNRRFQEHDPGYRFEPTSGHIVRLNSEFLHHEVVEPAITLLRQAGFDGAQEEFIQALQHFRKRELPDALVDANNAFESTMKTICQHRGIPLTGDENAARLIDITTQLIIPKHLKSSLGSLTSIMQALPSLRNKTPSAGHGRGTNTELVLDHLAAYAFHLAATNIVFLIEAWQALDASDNAE